ncbi:hypothetical protein [Clostridium sp.]|uniref:hypothetical protein n=1 Tax=Clostridium sp. TaxID=1506 RepID=UPI002FCC5B84
MPKLTLLEFFLRGIPETFIFIFAAYAFSKTSFDLKRYLLSSIVFAIVGSITRMLPTHNGVHTILNLFAFIIIASSINKIDLIKSIKVGVITVILQSVCELINIIIIQFIFKQDMNYILGNPTLKTLYGIPSILIFGITVISYYIVIVNKKELRQVTNGKNM